MTKKSIVCRLAAVLASLSFITLTASGPAHAEAPVDVGSRITDESDVLGDDRPAVQDALDGFFDQTGFQLFVVYVDTFDEQSGYEWADATADESGLGTTDILVAVATESGGYGISVGSGQPITDEEREVVRRERILPALNRRDWAAVAIEAADGYADATRDRRLPWFLIVPAAFLIFGVGAYLVHRVRGRYRAEHPELDEHGQPRDPLTMLSTSDLLEEAAASLVATDNALRASEHGLDPARAHLSDAFAIKQRHDDSLPSDEAETRALAKQIIVLCEEVDDSLVNRLDQHTEVHESQGQVREGLELVDKRAADMRERLSVAQSSLERRGTDDTRSQTDLIADNAAYASRLLDLAARHTAAGHESLRADDRGAASSAKRVAEAALRQAGTLLGAVDNASAPAPQATTDHGPESLDRLTRSVTALGIYVETRRGAVGAAARTRLSEAARHLDLARRTYRQEPAAAGDSAQRAEELLGEGERLAQRDFEDWDRQHADGVVNREHTSADLAGISVDSSEEDQPAPARFNSTPE